MDSIRKQTVDFFRNTAENGLEIRQGQVEMADEVCTAFEKRLPLAVEAEVGIGKSFAYLVPAVLKFVQDHKQIVITTSTIALQEQLNRDVHNVLKMLGVNIDIVVAKGMKNYICKRRLKGFVSRNKQDFIAQKLWNIMPNGSQDIAKINMKIPDKILEKATIRNFGNEYCNICESTMSCEYSAIRKQIASGNNIVICNQNMFISHLINSNRSQGIFNENCSVYIIDEAHNLESKFRDAFSVSYSRKDLMNKINGCSKMVSSDKFKLVRKLVGSMCETIQTLYVELNRQVHQQQRCIDEGANSFFFTRTKEVLINAKELHRKIARFEKFTEVSIPDVKRFIEEIISPDRNKIMWIENGENIRLCICKKDISRDISRLLFGKCNVILTSATISCRQDGTPMEKCEYFLNNIHFPTSGIVSEPKKSPFDYESNTMMYVSQNMPFLRYDKKEEYCEKSIVEIVQLLEITQGKTLILFTSKSDMEFVYRKLSNMNLPYKMLIQNRCSSQAYQLKCFINDINSVILGSGIYWEGINVEGESLSQVIIYKLPFPYPDPIISCKMAEANDPLIEIAVPEGKVRYQYKNWLGYQKGADGKPEIVPDEAETVRIIFEKFLDGYSSGDIAKMLNEIGRPTVHGRLDWRNDGILRILRNEKYAGDCLLQKTYTIDCISHKTVKNNGERTMYLVSDAHPAIINRDTFNLVQQELARRNSKRKVSDKAITEQGKYSSKYALTELLICGECGTPFRRCTWNVHGKKRIVWRCISRLDHGSRYCKNSPTIHEEPLHRAIVKAINEFYNCSDEAAEILRNNAEKVLSGLVDNEVVTIENRLKEIEKARNDFINLIAEKACDEDSLDDEFAKLFAEEENLSGKLISLKSQNTAEKSNPEIDKITSSKFELEQFNDIIIRKVIECVKVLSKTEILIIFKGGFEVKVDVDKK